eukprot:PhF_6_TR5180/c0_g1_i4/m.7445
MKPIILPYSQPQQRHRSSSHSIRHGGGHHRNHSQVRGHPSVLDSDTNRKYTPTTPRSSGRPTTTYFDPLIQQLHAQQRVPPSSVMRPMSPNNYMLNNVYPLPRS